MNTAIPPTVLSGILASRLSPETIAASLNAAEEKYLRSQKKRHGNAKRMYPFWKICKNCNTPFQTFNHTQALRNITCSQDCRTVLLMEAGLVRRCHPADLPGMSKAICAACGKEFYRNAKYLARVTNPVCSRQCNGVFRGVEWKQHAHKGRAAWKPESEAALIERITGESNPAWKGGVTYRDRKGVYDTKAVKYIRCPPEFIMMARKDGYVMAHRLSVAQHLNRVLLRTEIVHHWDHDPTNNELANLMLFSTNGEHKAFEEWKGHRTALVRVLPFHYTGKVWCLRVRTGAFVAVRGGVAFPTGNSGFPKSQNISFFINKAAGEASARGKGFNVAGQNVGLNQNRELRSDHPDYVKPEAVTPEAAAWQGWGTALKPAMELICLVTKTIQRYHCQQRIKARCRRPEY